MFCADWVWASFCLYASVSHVPTLLSGSVVLTARFKRCHACVHFVGCECKFRMYYQEILALNKWLAYNLGVLCVPENLPFLVIIEIDGLKKTNTHLGSAGKVIDHVLV